METIGLGNLSTALFQQLRALFEENKEKSSAIAAVYVFGSYTTGMAREESDLDLAFLIDQRVYVRDQFENATLVQLFGAKIAVAMDMEVDITILNDSSIEIAYEVVTTAICLYESETGRRLEYEAVVRGMYFDFKPFLDELRNQCLKEL